MLRDKFVEATLTHPEGFTMNTFGEVYTPASGFAVARQDCNALDDLIEQIGDTEFAGYWVEPETGYAYFSIVNIFDDFLTAFATALSRGEKSMYDFRSDKVILLQGFYDVGQDEERVSGGGAAPREEGGTCPPSNPEVDPAGVGLRCHCIPGDERRTSGAYGCDGTRESPHHGPERGEQPFRDDG